MNNLVRLQAVKNIANVRAFGGSLKKAILAAGYSEEMATNPKKITDSKWFREVMPDYNKTATAIHELMDAARHEHYVFPTEMSNEEIKEIIESIAGCRLFKIKRLSSQVYAYYHNPDNKSKKDAIEIVLKVRGDFAPQKIEITDPASNLTNDQLDAKIAELEGEIRARESQGGVNNG